MDLRIYGVFPVMECGPLLLATKRLGMPIYNGGAPYVIGKGHLTQAQAGVPGVIDREPPRANDGGIADIAGNATTQILRFSVERPDMRVIMTPVLSHYRMLARRSAGISSLEDLKGKRVATYPRTSAAYYLVNELETAGLTEKDITLIHAAPANETAATILDGRADAVAIWEPACENARLALGDDAITFRSPGAYSLLYALNTTTGVISDPKKRRESVLFLREVIRACKDITADPSIVWPLSVEKSGYPLDQVARCWHHHSFPGNLAPDLLDWLVREEKWVAEEQDRAPRPRSELAKLIDDSVLREAMAN